MRLERSNHGNILVVAAGGNVDSVGAETAWLVLAV